MFPMKFFEYLAAGCPVVATPLPALEGFQAIHQVANDTNGFIVAIEAALTSKVSHMLPADHAVLQAHSWNTRMSTMIATIEDHIRLAG
jgi:glycosyltransferase involved in cell wall biosynthesis